MVSCICMRTDKKLLEFASRAKKDVQNSRIAECTCHKQNTLFFAASKKFCGKLYKHMTADVSYIWLLKNFYNSLLIEVLSTLDGML